jgi:hypothetical protein
MAGKGNRTRSKAKRDAEKKNRKALQKALYQGFALKGNNSKRKQIETRKGGKLVARKNGESQAALAFKRDFVPSSKQELSELDKRMRNGLLFTPKGEAQFFRAHSESHQEAQLKPLRSALAEQILNPTYQGAF